MSESGLSSDLSRGACVVSSEDKLQTVSAEALVVRVLPKIASDASEYRKVQPIRARAAMPGEHVVTVNSVGKETEQVASEGDMLVENQTRARERYLVGGDTFSRSYRVIDGSTHESHWKDYEPRGRVRALQIGEALCSELGVCSPFTIEAPWGELQKLAIGDYLVVKSDRLASAEEAREVYGIAHREFHETYALREAP